MSEQNRKALKNILLFLIGLIIGLIITNIISVVQYNNLYDQYVDQVVEHSVLMKEHTELTDAYWSLQQNILKQ